MTSSSPVTSPAARYSRQTAAYGERCGTRIFTSLCIVAFHAGTSTALAAETLKNLALSGVRELCLVDDGTPFDAAAHVSSNSLVHPFILQQEKKQQQQQQAATAATVTDALVCGLRELNDGMIVSTIHPQQPPQSAASWFERVHNAVRQKFEQVARNNNSNDNAGNSSGNSLLLLMHPHDRRENRDMARLFSELEAGNVPYMHVQTAGVYGRLTNWFGRRFRVLDATPAQTVQATVASLGVEGAVHVSSNNNQDDDDGNNSNARVPSSVADSKCHGPFITLIDDDISADSLSGNPISVDDTFRLIFTGNKSTTMMSSSSNKNMPAHLQGIPLLQQQLAEFDSRFDGFTITHIETITNQITDKSTKKYYFSLNNNNKSSSIDEIPSGDAIASFRTWAFAAAAARMPLRFSQQPPALVITNFDTAPRHVSDLDSETGLILRALTKAHADQKPVQSAQVANDVQEALCDIGARAEGTPFGHPPILYKRASCPELGLRARQAARTCRLQPNFWATFLGAVAAQEALKFFTQRWVPASRPMCFDMAQLLPQKPASAATVSPTDFFPEDAVSSAAAGAAADDDDAPNNNGNNTNLPDIHYSALFGAARLEQLRSARVFLVGAGALGCEYLKTFALMGIGASGKGVITVTDDDSIATSNLSRQLLFRAEHVGHNKSAVATAAGKEMARLALKHRGGAVNARALQKRLDDESSHPISGVFNHRFWSQQTVLVSGVDNVKARSFLSEMSQQHLVPLVDGGTNGPLGHVAAILPFVVSPLQPPPPDNKRIAVCTLHFFPTTVAHCSHHALHTFRTLFGEKEQKNEQQQQQQQQKTQEDDDSSSQKQQQQQQHASKSSSAPNVTLDDALRESCKLWFPMFVQPVLDLRRSKPPDALEADGCSPYYSPLSSRRCPNVPEFDPVEDEAHRAFVCSCAKLLLRSVNVSAAAGGGGDSAFEQHINNINNNGAVDEADDSVARRCVELATAHGWKDKMAELVSSYVPKLIQIPNDSSAAKSMIEEEEETETLEKDRTGSQDGAASNNNSSSSKKKKQDDEPQQESVFARHRTVEMEFEKDDEDMLDFVWAATVVRARAYSIFAPERSDVQRIAGRMIPALITTTAVVVAGGLFNICALLLHHNPIRPFKNPRAGTAAALSPIVSAADLKQSSAAIWDYMVNLSDGNNGVFSFQQVLDTEAPLDIENTADDRWLRALVRVPSDGAGASDFSLFDLVATMVKQHLVQGNHAVGPKKFAARAKHFAAASELAAAAGLSGSNNNNDDGSTVAAFDFAAVKHALEKCVVILKLRIGTSTQTVFQHTPGMGSAGSASAGGGGGGAGQIQVRDFPAHMFLTTFLGEGSAPPFVESEVLIHPGVMTNKNADGAAAAAAASASSSGEEETGGVTIFARLMI